MTADPVLLDPSTEPEAAHLRSVLRQLLALLGSGRVGQALGVIDAALRRPSTNGFVIDSLTTANGDLQSRLLLLQDRLRQQAAELGGRYEEGYNAGLEDGKRL